MLRSAPRGARRCTMSPRGVMLAGKPRPAAPLYVLGQCPHGFLGDFDAFATVDRGFRNIDGGKDFGAATFALDPKRHRGLHSVFGTLKPAACDSLPDKILLFSGEVYLHAVNVTGPGQKSGEGAGAAQRPPL